MGKEIIINARKDQTRIAIVENGELAEMYFEDPNNERTLGDIYLGRVRRIMPSIQAAFVDIGQPSDAFLHFSDIADNVGDMISLLEMDQPDVGKVDLKAPGRRRRPRGPSGGQVSMDDDEDHAEEARRAGSKSGGRSGRQGRGDKEERGFRPEDLKKDQKILVKIVKEPISSKGSRVSTDISLAGRFLVLVPLADYVAVSKKIVSYKERRRLRALARSLLPKGFGLIVRTVAEDKNAKSLDTDLRLLVEKWRRIEKRLGEVKNPPTVLHQDVNMVSSVIRDLFSDDYEQILIDDQRVYRNVKGYIQAVAPQMAPAVKAHSDRKPVFQAAGIEKSVRQAFEKRVDLPSGGYLIIEHTEAMRVIDVNSGRAGRGLSQEQNSLKVNLEAARMIAQQLRLRDLGGIIVVDFIDLRDDKNRKKVFDELKKHFRKDRAVTKLLPMSDFGLIQITRQRLRPSITTVRSAEEPEATAEADTSGLTGGRDRQSRESARPKMTPEEWRDKLERWVVRYHEKGDRAPLILKLHPFARTFLGKGVTKASLRWFWKYRVRVRIESDPEQNPLSFRFYDAASGDELTRRRRSGRRRGRRNKRGEGDATQGRENPTERRAKDGPGSRKQESGQSRRNQSSRSRPKREQRPDAKREQKRSSKRTPKGTPKGAERPERKADQRPERQPQQKRQQQVQQKQQPRSSQQQPRKEQKPRQARPEREQERRQQRAESEHNQRQQRAESEQRRQQPDNEQRDRRQQQSEQRRRQESVEAQPREQSPSAEQNRGEPRPGSQRESGRASGRESGNASGTASGNAPRQESRREGPPPREPKAEPRDPVQPDAEPRPKPTPKRPEKTADPIRTMFSSSHRPDPARKAGDNGVSAERKES